jgi:hypothetical protein
MDRRTKIDTRGTAGSDVLRDLVRTAMPPEGLESFVKHFRRTVDDVVDLYSTAIRHQFAWLENIVDNHIRLPEEGTASPAERVPQVSAERLSSLPPEEEQPASSPPAVRSQQLPQHTREEDEQEEVIDAEWDEASAETQVASSQSSDDEEKKD